jgi:folate-binding protein YgfZ
MAPSDSLASIYAQARERGALLDLSDRAAWRLTGPDRVRYLNGQVTSDVRKLSGNAASPACVTTARGKLSGVIYVSQWPDFLRIDAEPVLRDSLTARLGRYIIADDVELEDITGQESLFHLLPAGFSPDFPGAETRLSTRFGTPGFDIIAPGAQHDRLLEHLAMARIILPPPLVESIRIEAGIPAWGAELTEDTLPPEAGLDKTAIDYHKGCYIGQEVISRIKSVGHVNRQLTGFTAPVPLSAGMTLHPIAEPDKTAGEITSAAWSFGLEIWAALGYLKRAFSDVALHARSSDGATFAVESRALPLVP